MGDELFVHRLRCGNWVPSSIKSLAVDSFTGKVAIGREDGDIEIVSPQHKWYTNVRIPGKLDFKLQKLVWSTNEDEQKRLFGISLRGFLFEVDVASLQIRNVRDSYGGIAWCLAASPRQAILAVGCEDSCARLYTYADGRLEYKKALPGTGARVLSVAYHPSQPKLFLGCSDGTIRCMDEDSGRSILRMAGDFGKGLNTYIWSLMVLHDSTVISGDNRGHVQFWDGVNGVLMVKFHQHTSEILALAVSEDESQIFASGTDNRVTCIQRYVDRSISQTLSPSDSTWTYNSSHRPHTHDIFALAVVVLRKIASPSSSSSSLSSNQAAASSSSSLRAASLRSGSILISGGLDCKLCIYSASDFARTRPTFVLPVPARGLIKTSSNGGTMAMMHRNHVDIWQLTLLPVAAVTNATEIAESEPTKDSRKKNKKDAKKKESIEVVAAEKPANALTITTTDGEGATTGCALDLRIECNRDTEHLHCIALSPDGKFVALSKLTGLSVYHIGTDVVKLVLPEDLMGLFVHAISFSPDSRCLSACCSNGDICFLDIIASSGIASLSRLHCRHVLNHHQSVREYVRDYETMHQDASINSSRLESLVHVIGSASFSVDGCYLAVSDALHTGYVYELDTMRLLWRLPDCSSDIVCVAFNPFVHHQLSLVLANNTFILYDIDAMKMVSWSESHSQVLPQVFAQVNGPFEGITFASKDMVFLHGQGFVSQINMKQCASQHPNPRIISSSSSSIVSDIEHNPKYMHPANASDASATSSSLHKHSQSLCQSSAKKRKRNNKPEEPKIAEKSTGCSIIELYRSVVYCGMHLGSMVIVENPWVRILETLPGVVARKRYGT